MEEFYDILIAMGLENTIRPPSKERPIFIGEERVYEFLTDIVQNNRKTLLYGDYDVDGLMGLLLERDTFKEMGFSNYEVFQYKSRTHNLDPRAVVKAIEEKFDYIVIADTASSEMAVIKKLDYFNVKVVILDHHQTTYKYNDYPSNCAIINTTIENKLLGDEVYTLSAGALTYLVMKEFAKRIKAPFNEGLVSYATISLYADCIDMSKELNRAIYYESMTVEEINLPKYVRHFLEDNMRFNRRFIEFQFTPKINSLFRSERFDLLNRYVLSEHNSLSNVNGMLKEIVEVYEGARELVDKCTDIIEHRVLDNFVIGNLSSVDSYVSVNENKLYNYTGLVANKLGDRYGRTAIVYADSGRGIKGSLRDLLSRNYLTLFQQFCNANGHNAAFGINLNYVEFQEFIEYIERIDKKFFIQAVPNSPIIVNHNLAEPDRQLLMDMALYNEFSGNQIPIALLEKRLVGAIQEVNSKFSSKYYTNYKWGEHYIQSSTRLQFGTNMYIKPIKTKNVKLLVYENNIRR